MSDTVMRRWAIRPSPFFKARFHPVGARLMRRLFPPLVFLFAVGGFGAISADSVLSPTRGVLFIAAAESMMAWVVSLTVLAGALVVILAPRRFGSTSQKWAYGAAGVVLGYWLRP